MILKSKVVAFNKKVRHAKVLLRKMKRDGEPAEDIGVDKEYIVVAEKQLSNAVKRLSEMQLKNAEKCADGEGQPD